MHQEDVRWGKKAVVWAVLVLVISVPIIAAARSPLLAWRDPIYILAGFAGIVGMALLLVQPLLIAGYMPGLPKTRGRRVHHWIGGSVVLAVTIHVAALWVTSPPDVVDALLFVSPTPFSIWGVIAMWAVFISAVLALLRRRLHVRPLVWRRTHGLLAVTIMGGSVIHALLIEGTMEPVSKAILCISLLVVTLMVVVNVPDWIVRRR
ncbi:ferric reductase-like transmembrane domain-containing protein [Sulfitobacter sp.]|uniref:ferric reductase-like transmembrane domain-containing protein n=1 Tax=Sulfitobacter sp. TaxID=1903071 RepID=UPI00300364EE